MSRKTVIMALITAVLFFVLLQDLRQAPESTSGGSRFIFNVDPETITDIRIKRKGDRDISLSRINQEWYILEPIETPAASSSVAPVLRFIESALFSSTFSKSGTEDFNLSRYGLDSPPISVSFKAEGTQYGFDVSNVYENKALFIRRHSEEDKVYSTFPHFYNYFNRGLDHYRPHTIFSFNNTDVRSLKVTGKTELLIIKPEGQMWQIEEPLHWPGSPDVIASYLNDLKSLRIKDFIVDEPSEEQRKKFSIKGSSKKIQLVFKDREPKILSIGEKTDNGEAYYFSDNSSNGIFTVSSKEIEQVLSPEIELFRNRDLAVFESEIVSAITLDNIKQDSRVEIVRQSLSSPWKCIWPENEEVGTSRINNFIKTFINTQIVNFIMEGEKNINIIGLNEPDIIITFYTRLSEDKRKKIYRLFLRDKGEKLIYGYIEGSDSVLRIPYSLFSRLSRGLAAFKSLFITHGATGNITHFSISGTNRVRLECRLRDRLWKAVEPQGVELKRHAVNDLVNVLSNLKTEQIVTLSIDNYQKYGLDNPRVSVSFTAFGRNYTLLIGDTATGSTESYVKLEKSDIVYSMARETINILTADTGHFIKAE